MFPKCYTINEKWKPATVPAEMGMSITKIIMAAFQVAVKKLDEITDKDKAFKASIVLFCGAGKNSSMVGVHSLPTLAEFITELPEKNICFCIEHPDSSGDVLISAEIPKKYQGFCGVIKYEDLTKLQKREVRLEESGVYKMGVSELVDKMYWPAKKQVETDSVTFILTPDMKELKEWFAGPDPRISPPTINLCSHWVTLGPPPVDNPRPSVVRRVYT